ncbi:hypothetical protein [Lacipirellula parvula]|uniref:hypothetical protein n=1 Tax=Lacipirellula parvula TaxID=2650471 RepID=UPI001260FFF5|nr:hypothetical protein [Lacipirellula parvula]
MSAATLLRTAAVATVLAAVGCGAGSSHGTREPISGSVTVDGQPLERGYLVFEPKAGQATQSGGIISAGTFSVPAEKGADPGAYSVAIFAEAKLPTTTAEAGTPEYEQAMAADKGGQVMIPEKYNVKTELTAEVKTGGENTFVFDLSTK